MTFACVLKAKKQRVYSPIWVERLVRQAREHLRPSRIVCLTDTPLTCCETIPLAHDWATWFSKIELFRPGLFSGPTFYVDLDSLILGSIAELERLIVEHGRLMMLDDLYEPEQPASGIMAWVPSPETSRIYSDFVRDPAAGMRTRDGDGGWIGQYPHLRLQNLFPGVFRSFKADKLDAGPGDTKICCFHGTPKFNDLDPVHWAYRAWEGSDGRSAVATNFRRLRWRLRVVARRLKHGLKRVAGRS
jgi:hypothetical protein